MSEHTQHLKELFAKAASIDDPAKRGNFLAQACENEPALRKQLDDLLEAHEAATDFIPLNPASNPSQAKETALTEAEGSVIGRYKLLQNIGEGGCGVVYMAEQQQPVTRRVALKIIKLGMDTKQVVARFEAERQALAMMEHPNIAKVLDAGATDTGRPFFVMELVRGIPITEFCDQHQLDMRSRLELFMDVCSAIQHAHQKGVIHRDIKPSNIMVSMHDHRAVPKIIDFGIAKATQQKLTDKTLFTQFHHFIGTPAYMSPEQANISGLDVDTRSDIYSLGVLLYELMTGRTPLDAQELTRADYDEMRRRIREEEPIYPSTQVSGMQESDLSAVARRRNTEPSRLNRLMRGELDWIVMKALEKDRNRRYETAAEFSLDIQRYLQFEPVKAAAPSSLYRFRKFARRNKGVLTAAAMILTLLVVGSVLSTYLAVKATMAQREADDAAQKAIEARALAEDREKDVTDQKNLAVQSAKALRENLYASDMYQAQNFLREDNIAKSRELLIKYLPQSDDDPDLRGFEWQYLWDRSEGNELYVFEDLQRPVGAITFSHDGRWLAGLSDEGVAVWSVVSRSRVALLDAGSSNGWPFGMRVRFSADDRYLFVGRDLNRWRRSGSLAVWKTDNWSQIHSYRGLSFPLYETSASGVFSAHGPEGIHQFDLTSPEKDAEVQQQHPFSEKVLRSYAFSADAQLIAMHDRGQEAAAIYEVSTARKLADWPELFSGSGGLISIANGMKYVAWISDPMNRDAEDMRFRLFAPFEEREIILDQSQPGMLMAAEFSPDTQWLVAGGWDYLLHVWNAASGKKVGSFKGHLDEIFSLAFSPNSQTLASGSKDGRVYLWDLRSMKEKQEMETVDYRVAQEQASSIQQLQDLIDLFPQAIWAECDRGNLDVFSPPQLERQGLRVSPDGKHRVAPGEDGHLEVFNLQTGLYEASLAISRANRGWRSGRYQGQFISNQRFLYHNGEKWLIWNVMDDRLEPRPIPEVFTTFKGASDDGRYLALSKNAESPEVWIYDFDAGKEISVLSGMDHNPRGMVFSPDGSLVTSIGWDKRVQVWESQTGTISHVLTGHKQGVASAAFSYDGKSICTSSPDGTIRLWHLDTGREMVHFTPEGVGADKLRFSRDNQLLLIFGREQTWTLRVPSLRTIDEELSKKHSTEKTS